MTDEERAADLVFLPPRCFSPPSRTLLVWQEEGEAGRRQYKQYERLAALAFAVVQAVGQVLYIRPFVDDFSTDYLAAASLTLTAGAMILVFIGDAISELKVAHAFLSGWERFFP